jgi:flagellar hook assembly protein FlgD
VLITNRAGRLLHVHAITQPFAGPRTVYWDGRDLLGRVVPADWYRITAFARSETEAARGSSTIAVSYGPKLSFYDTKTYSTRPQTVTTTVPRT